MDHAAIAHCLAQIEALITEKEPDCRSVLQLGYNLGRLSELTHLGRALWDRWKGPVAAWDQQALRTLVQNLHESCSVPTRPED